jgi:hypothetical protein
LPAPEGVAVGTEVFFMRLGELPDANGNWKPVWFMEESGRVASDGMIRTNSLPWPGVTTSGTYSVVIPTFRYNVVKAQLKDDLLLSSTILSSIGIAFSYSPSGGNVSTAFSTAATLTYATAMLINPEETVVTVVEIPRVGTLPFTTTANVEVNPAGLRTATVRPNNVPPAINEDAFQPPVLSGAEVNYDTGNPIVYLTGSNFLNNSGDTGSRFEDLIVTYRVGGQSYKGFVNTGLSQKLQDGTYRVAINPPAAFSVGDAQISIARIQKERYGVNPFDVKEMTYKSKNEIRITPGNEIDLALVAQVWNDSVSVIDALDPEKVLANPNKTSLDLLLARIPVGTEGLSDSPRYIAATSDATRAYVTLEQSGQVGVVDLLMFRQVDAKPLEVGINPIVLTYPDATPFSIAIGNNDKYAYVGDRHLGVIYVIDIDPASTHYNQHIGSISVDAPNGINQLKFSQDKRRLFATAPGSDKNSNGNIIVINVDSADRPVDPANNSRRWHRQIGKVEAGLGVYGLASTPFSSQMSFTNRREEARGFGVLTITDNDPLSFSASVNYVKLGLGSTNDYFDVNEAITSVITPDAHYAFVAGRNGIFATGVPSFGDPLSGSNIGVIENPLTPQARLIAATRPIPMGITTDLVLSNDGSTLYASYPGVGSVLGFNVNEIIKTIKSTDSLELGKKPLDDINPKISIAADLKDLSTPLDYLLNGFVDDPKFGVPDGSKRPPITLGNNPYGMTEATNKKWVVIDPVGQNGITSPNPLTTDLTPTFIWNFDPSVNINDIDEVDLFVSTFATSQ